MKIDTRNLLSFFYCKNITNEYKERERLCQQKEKEKERTEELNLVN